MSERCYVMVKPGFVRDDLISDVIDTIEKEDIYLVSKSLIEYDLECARLHYIEKEIKPYFNELTDYLTSGPAFGMVFEGENAVTRCRDIVESLRTTLKEKYDLTTDVMRNILHCSSRTKVHDVMLELDTQREMALYYYLKKKIKDNK